MGTQEGKKEDCREVFHLLRGYINNHKEAIGEITDTASHNAGVLDGKEECVTGNWRRPVLFIKWQRDWLKLNNELRRCSSKVMKEQLSSLLAYCKMLLEDREKLKLDLVNRNKQELKNLECSLHITKYTAHVTKTATFH